MREELVKRFETNYRRFLERIREHPAPMGAQLMLAAQHTEAEAYEEAFGEAYMELYWGVIVAGGLGLDFVEKARAQIKETPLNEIVEQFKDGFLEVLVEVAKMPVFEAISYGTEFRRAEARLADEMSPQGETRFKLTYWPVQGWYFSVPWGWHIIGYERTAFLGERVIGYKEVGD